MRPVIALLLVLLAGSAWAPAVHAEAPLEARITAVENKFPEEVVFTAEAESTAADIRSMALRLSIGAGDTERYGNFEFTPGRKVSAQFSFKTGGNNHLVPGADIAYWLEVQDAAGNRLETPRQSFWYADTRFQWSNLREGPVTVYYYGNAERNARAILGAARETQEKVGRMLGSEARPFKVMLYNSVPDLVGAQRPEGSETRRRELIRAGVAYSGEALVQVLGIGSLGALDTARHEIAHLFVHWAAGVNVPAWLNEGLAVWGQSDPGDEYIGALRRGIRTNDLLLLRGLESFPGRSDENILAYGQSYSVVNYLIESYGPAKMRQLLEVIRAGDGAIEGVRRVYGLTMDELDAKWRESVGAPSRSYESTAPTPIAVPTIAPIGALPPPEQQPAGGAAAPGAAAALPPFLLVLGALGAGLLALVGGATVVMLAKRRG
ncbi:MAG: hypothetical protein HYY02_11050 [Chloroflexi bacterium]|nr:hypothetical protein [Chloroflexota bacterium]